MTPPDQPHPGQQPPWGGPQDGDSGMTSHYGPGAGTPTFPDASADPSQRTTAAIVHASQIIGGFIGPLIGYLTQDGKDFAKAQSKEALNFSITIAIAAVVSSLLMLVMIGFLLLPLVGLVNLVLPIMAAVKSSQGEAFTYPFTLRLIS